MRVVAVAAFALWPLAIFADEVHLKDGSILVGKVEDLGSRIRIHRRGQSITIPRERVKKIVFAPLPEDLYEKRKAALEPDDLEGHLRLARWCLRQNLKEEAEEQFRIVLKLDPDHPEARQALGYRRTEDGSWATEEEIMAARGLVKFEGQWVTPEERERRKKEKAERKRARETARRVRRALNDLASQSEKRREEAVRTLESTPWRYKLEVFLHALVLQTTRARRYVARALGSSGSTQAAAGLVRAWLSDADEEVRRNARTSVRKLNAHDQVVSASLRGLFSERHDVRLRAIDLLLEFPDPRTPAYLLAVWEHNLAELDPAGAESVFGRVHRLPDGTEVVCPRRLKNLRHPMKEVEEQLRKAEIEAIKEENRRLVEALETLTGEKHGEDPGAWKAALRKE